METIKLKHLLVILVSLLIMTSCKKEDELLSSLTGITSFGFTDDIIKDFPFTVDNTSFVINNNDSLPYQFDVSNLIAKFSVISGSTVMVGGVAQTSGTSVNNFTNEVTYTVIAQDGVTTKNYNVKLDIAKLNPEAVQWNQKSPNAFDSTFQTQEYFYLKGKHWVIIGKKFVHFGGTAESKLYSSTDGVSWNEETPMGDFPQGFNHNIIIRNNKAYVIGVVTPVDKWGQPDPTLESNLFTTEDGITWTKIEGALDGSRILSPIFNLGNNLYAFGGNLKSGFGPFTGAKRPDAPFFPPAGISLSTLISTDGMTFTATDYSGIVDVKRTLSAGYVYNNKMYVAGGLDTRGHPLSDVWSSTDGITWTSVSDGGFTPRIKASAVVYDNKVWMFGGQLADGTCTNEIIVSEDGGVSWTSISDEKSLPQNFTPRCNANITVDANGNIWIVGGETTSVTTDADGNRVIETTILTDVWTGKLNKL